MTHWLSFWSMNRSWQRLCGRASAVLGLLLVASLVYAGSTCVSAYGVQAPERGAGACFVAPQRIDVRGAAAAPSSPEPLPAAGVADHSAAIWRAAAEPRSPAGLAPASPVPVHILLRRYLS
jgi:hypothetical protein